MGSLPHILARERTEIRRDGERWWTTLAPMFLNTEGSDVSWKDFGRWYRGDLIHEWCGVVWVLAGGQNGSLIKSFP